MTISGPKNRSMEKNKLFLIIDRVICVKEVQMDRTRSTPGNYVIQKTHNNKELKQQHKSEHQVSSPGVKQAGVVKVTTRPQLVQRLRMNSDIPPPLTQAFLIYS
jgi:hypothetical protein